MKKRIKTFLAAVAFVFMTAGILASSVGADAEESSVNTINVNQYYYLKNLKSSRWSSKNWYELEINVTQPGRIYMSVEDCLSSVSGSWYFKTASAVDYSLDRIMQGTSDGGNTGYLSVASGKWTLKFPVTTVNTETRVKVRYEKAGMYAGEMENNDNYDTANEIVSGKYAGDYSKKGDRDFYKFVMESPGKVEISMEGSGYGDGFSVHREEENGNIETLKYDKEYFRKLRLPKGTYYIEIKPNRTWDCEYSLELKITLESPAAYEQEANNVKSMANEKYTNTWYIGNINKIYQGTDVDWYYFDVLEKSYLKLELQTQREAKEKIDAVLYDFDGNELAQIESGSNPHIESEEKLTEQGRYYVKISSSETMDWDYSVRVDEREYIPLEALSLPPKMQVTLQQSKILQPVATPENASEQEVIWSSSNTNVAYVDEGGKVTARNAGKAVITARALCDQNIKAECEITVYVPLTAIILPASKKMQVNQKVSLTPKLEPANATEKTLSWTSSNASIVSVDEKGMVTAKAVGTAVITAAAKQDGRIRGTCRITVEKAGGQIAEGNSPEIKLNKKTAKVTVGETVKLQLKGGSGKVEWTSLKPSVATVDADGTVKGKTIGKAKIQAVYGGKSYTCTVKVKAKFKKCCLYGYSNGGFYFWVHKVKGKKMTVSIRMPYMTCKKLKATIKANGKTATAKFRCMDGALHRLTIRAYKNRVKVVERAACGVKLVSMQPEDYRRKISHSFYPGEYFGE